MTLLEVTTLAQVKQVMGADGTSEDDNLGVLIAGVSQKLEDWSGAKLAQESVTEEYDVGHAVLNSRHVFLRSFPAASITSVKVRATITTAFADVDAEDAEDYNLDTRLGRLHMVHGLYAGHSALQVVYTAGMAADTAAFIAAYPALAAAAAQQVVHEFRRRTSMGPGTVDLGGESQAFVQGVTWLPVVKDAWGPYHRQVIA